MIELALASGFIVSSALLFAYSFYPTHSQKSARFQMLAFALFALCCVGIGLWIR